MGKKEKQERKRQEYVQKYRLTSIDDNDMVIVEEIAIDLAGLEGMKSGLLLIGKSADTVKMGYLSAIVKQNWIIIRRLSEISDRLAGTVVEEHKVD